MQQITESELKALASIVPFSFVAMECCGGHSLIAVAETMGGAKNEYSLFTTNGRKLRVFKTLDALKNTIRGLGLSEFTLTIKP